MTNYTLIHDYKDNAIYRRSFNQLARDTFGIDFERWYLDGHWNDRYICHSYVTRNQVIANVSVSKMDILLQGQRKNAIQIGTVMTHPGYRGKGLSKELMHIVFDTYESQSDFIYLFAHSGVVNFYPRFGFTTLPETLFTLKVERRKVKSGGIRKMDTSNQHDRKIIDRLIAERIPVSSVFGVEHAEHLLSFYAYNILIDAWYYAEKEDVIFVYKQDQTTLHLYDVIGTHMVDFDFLARHILQEETTEILFYFTPDLLNIKPDASGKGDEALMFIKPATLSIESQFTYPMTAQA